ncbi:calcium-binding protein [Sagittula sp. SSi028]|uniref:calcium-binding protein n=1 Tax=Sagittula sp. SSi028 TaxID=3400636 RepID=UPI003AF513C4
MRLFLRNFFRNNDADALASLRAGRGDGQRSAPEQETAQDAPVSARIDPAPVSLRSLAAQPGGASNAEVESLGRMTTSGEEAVDSLFGGNILAPRGEMTGEGSYADLVDDLGVTDLRYPGGSLTEEYFDIRDPDRAVVTGNENGVTADFIPISEFMAAAEEMGQPVTLVVPTRTQLSDRTDANGDRLTDIDEEALRDFVYDTVTGVYGDVEIQAFEIGNEYWGSGRMNSAEYGRLSAEMTEIIDSELQLIADTLGTEVDTSIVVQVGTNFDHASLSRVYDGMSNDEVIDDLNDKYDLGLDDSIIRGSGVPNWTEISNEIIMSFYEDGTIDALDGIVAHVYSKEPALDGQRSFQLNTIKDTWGDEFPDADLDIYVTEWNVSGASRLFDRNEDFGLFQSHEMLNMIEEFMYSGVDVAHAWPLLQNTSNAFSKGFEHVELTPAGKMFNLMSSHIPGKSMIDFDANDRDTEEELAHADLHGFYGDGDLALFLASTADGTETTRVDLGSILDGSDTAQFQILGVAAGDAPGSNSSEGVIRTLSADDVMTGSVLEVTLQPGEILVASFDDIDPAREFAPLARAIDTDSAPVAVSEEAEVTPLRAAPEPEGMRPRPDREDGVLKGTRGDDTLIGGDRNDKLKGGEGDDLVRGGGGRDRLAGGDGDDRLEGQRGDDLLKGCDGKDTLFGGSGDDTLKGGAGGDWLDAGSGTNVILTGFGRDTVSIEDRGDAFETRVTDFTLGRDSLRIRSDDVEDADDLSLRFTGEELIMTLAGDENRRIVLEGDYDEDEFWDSGSLNIA